MVQADYVFFLLGSNLSVMLLAKGLEEVATVGKD